MRCAGSGNPSNGAVTWQMTNKAYFSAALGLVNSAVLYHFSLSGSQVDPSKPQIDLGDAESDTLLKILVTIAHQDAHVPYLFPGETLHVDKTMGFLSTRADVTADPGATAVWGGVNNILSLLPDSAAQTQVASLLGTESSVSACVAGLNNALGCIEGLVAEAVGGVIDNPKLVTKAVLARVVSANLFMKAFAAAQWLGSFLAAETISNRGGDGVTLSDEPNAPTKDSEGHTVLPQCLVHNDTAWTPRSMRRSRLRTGDVADARLWRSQHWISCRQDRSRPQRPRLPSHLRRQHNRADRGRRYVLVSGQALHRRLGRRLEQVQRVYAYGPEPRLRQLDRGYTSDQFAEQRRGPRCPAAA